VAGPRAPTRGDVQMRTHPTAEEPATTVVEIGEMWVHRATRVSVLVMMDASFVGWMLLRLSSAILGTRGHAAIVVADQAAQRQAYP